MAIVVQKYGGSSVADPEKIKRVAAKVVATKKSGHDVVVVVSAMGKTTDELLALARTIDENPPRRELDMLLTTGERVTMALLSMAIQKLGVDAISFTGSQSGIITNDRHFDARIIEVRPHRVEDELARGRVVIIAGFQGMSYKREVTTLGRGGSDTTALAMAAALGAEAAEIYSDVDGVYSADPRVVSDAQHLPELSYDEMLEMSLLGAKVLHSKAVEIAREQKITIHARSTFGSDRETLVHRDAHAAVTPVVGARGIALVRLEGGPDHLLATTTALAEMGVEVRDILDTEGRTDVVLSVATCPDWQRSRHRLTHDLAAKVTEGFGMVSVPNGQSVAAIARTLREEGILHEKIYSGGQRTVAIIGDEDVDRATVCIHRMLVSGPKC